MLVRPGEDGPARRCWECLRSTARARSASPRAEIAADAPADLIALDLDHAEIADVPAEHLPAAVLFSGSSALVRETLGRRFLAAAAR